MFPSILTRLIKPAIGLVISKDPTGQDSTLAKNWRPITAVVLVALIVLSVFTDIELSDQLLTAIGAVLVVMVGGRSYEKNVKNALKEIGKLDDQ